MHMVLTDSLPGGRRRASTIIGKDLPFPVGRAPNRWCPPTVSSAAAMISAWIEKYGCARSHIHWTTCHTITFPMPTLIKCIFKTNIPQSDIRGTINLKGPQHLRQGSVFCSQPSVLLQNMSSLSQNFIHNTSENILVCSSDWPEAVPASL